MAKRRIKARKPFSKFGAAQHFSVFLALAPIISPFYQSFGNQLGIITSHPWMAMGSYLCVGIFLLSAWHSKHLVKRAFHLNYIDLALCLLILWMVLSLLWAHNRFESFNQLVYWFLALICYVFVRLTFDSKEHVKFLLQCLCFSAIVASVLGILQNVYKIDWVVQAAPPASFFGNKNMGAQYPLIIFPLSLALAFIEKRATHKIGYSIATAVMLCYILISLARAAYLGAFIALILFTALFVWHFAGQMQKWRVQLVATVATVVLSLFLLLAFNTGSGNSIHKYSKEIVSIADQAQKGKYGEGNVRLIKWHNAWELFKDHWFLGIGINNWIIEYPKYHQVHGNDYGVSISSQSDHTHNDFIQLAVELGVVGILLFFYLIYQVVLQSLRWRKHPNHLIRLTNIALIASCSGIAVDALFSFPLQLVNNIVLIVIFIALYASYGIGAVQQIDKPQKIGNSATLKLQALCIILATSSFVLYYYWFNAEIYMRVAHIENRAKNYRSSFVAAQKAFAYNPYRYDTLKYLAVSSKRLNHARAEKAIVAVLKSYPNNLNSLNRAVSFFIGKKKYSAARHYAEHMRDIAPRNAYVYQNLASIYQYMGLQPQFIAALKSLVAINPDHKQASIFREIINGYQSNTVSQ